MELRFRPKFRQDLLRLRGNPEVNEKLYSILLHIKSAENITEIPSHKLLDVYKRRFRKKIRVGETENYRIGFMRKGNTIWAERILPEKRFYKNGNVFLLRRETWETQYRKRG